jgi:hypothetical protein
MGLPQDERLTPIKEQKNDSVRARQMKTGNRKPLGCVSCVKPSLVIVDSGIAPGRYATKSITYPQFFHSQLLNNWI